MRFTRRQFLKSGAATAATVSSPHLLLQAFGHRTARAAGPADPILIILQWEGGNDGLNTIIPSNPLQPQRQAYDNLRSVVGIPVDELGPTFLKADAAGTELTLHPAMGFHEDGRPNSTLYDLWLSGNVAIVNGVGYPDQSLSHFHSEEIWFSGEVNNAPPRGWFGSYLDQFPLPGDPLNALVRAASVDRNITPLLDSNQASVLGFRELDDFTFPDDPEHPDLPARQVAWTNIYAEEANRTGVVGGVGRAANNVVSMLERLSDVDTSSSWSGDPDPSFLHVDQDPNMDFSLAESLFEVSSIIRHDVLAPPQDDTGLRFFHVRIRGFDTHSRQEQDDKLRHKTRHGKLLYRSSLAIKAFYDDMQNLGIGNRVLIMTFSEFGRRAMDNTSSAQTAGTEHGAAAPLFLIGESVGGDLYDPIPDLNDLDDDDNLKFGIDFRNVYATILEGWLGLTNAEANAVIPSSNPGDWNAIPGVLP